MKRTIVWACVLVFLGCLFASQARAASNKDAVVRVKSAAGKTASVDIKDLQPLLERYGKLYRSRADKMPKAAGISKWQRWAQADRSHQVMERSGARVHTHLHRGVVAVEPAPGESDMARPRAGEKPQDVALRYVADHVSIFGLKSPKAELAVQRSETDTLGMTHVFYRQYANGIPFWGRQLTAHVDRSGALQSINCLIQPTLDGLAVKPQITGDQAIAIAEKQLSVAGNPVTLTARQADLFGLEGPTAKLYHWQKMPLGEVHLVWKVEVRPNIQDWMRFFIAADDGEILEQYNATKFDSPATASAALINGQNATINTYDIGGEYILIDGTRQMFVGGQTGDQLKNDPKGVIWTLDLKNADLTDQSMLYYVTSPDNTWSDSEAVSAQYYTGLVYEYYLNLENHNRNSFDGNGKTMMALVRVGRNGQTMDNAFWNGSFVSLGSGNTNTTSWAGALDFIGHEFTHAVVQYTADLEYKFQSGALNETYADIGGVSIDNDDFLVGEDIVVQQYFPTGAMRDMSNPHNGGSGPNDLNAGWQPAHMNEYMNLTMEQDNGGVHVNNGITNFVAYKILNGVGRAKGEQILFRALVNYLNKQSNFTDFRIAAVKSAADLYGAGSVEEQAVKTAFDEVGIVEGAGTEPPEDKPVISGQQYIVAVNNEWVWSDLLLDYVKDNSLLISNGFNNLAEATGIGVLTFSQVNVQSGRPIAVDPYGQDIVFVDLLYNLRSIKPDGSGEAVVSDTGDWWSVALSPSGRRAAMTRSVSENIIHVLDFQDQSVTQLELFHPTTDNDNNYADVVNYADVLTFLDDEMLIYDSYNSVQSPGQGTIDFWDVNVIDVTNGQIFAVLPPQAQGVSVANPTLASTNNTILCVEVFQEGVFNDVVGVDLYSGQGNAILSNAYDGVALAFPDYSVDDQHLIFSGPNQDSLTDLFTVALGTDKVSAAAQPVGLVTNTQLPIWFTTGTPPSTSVGFAGAASSGIESVTAVNIAVNLTQPTNDTVTVDYAVTGGNAIGSGVDYTLESGRLTFNAQETAKSVVLAVVDDPDVEGSETVTITLSRPVNAWMGENTVHSYTIQNDDVEARNAVGGDQGWQLYR